MIKFNEQEKIDSVNGALALRSQINEIVDELSKDYKNLLVRYWWNMGKQYAGLCTYERIYKY